MNILIKPVKTDIVIPIMNIIMSNKSYSSLMYIFNDLNLILFLNQITIDWKNIVIVTDFEKGLIKAIEDSFPQSKYIGYYYHYCKCLWVYAKNHMCYNKNTKNEIYANIHNRK